MSKGVYQRKSLQTRFAESFRVTSDCWFWTGAVDGTGRGTIKDNGIMRGAHRVSWEIHHGKIPEGMCVCHTCDNGLCVNPGHLFLGTHKDNMRDMKRKKRQAFGSRQGSAKLSSFQVSEIRSDCRPQTQIAAAYGIGQTQVSRIKRRERWTHI